MLNKLSSSEEVFNNAKPEYQEALYRSGYHHNLEYKNDTATTPTSKNRSRSRKALWFNPPFSSNVKNDIGRKFLKIVDKIFTKTHPLSKIFNRTTLKISYMTCSNLGDIISKHNAKILKSNQEEDSKECTCRKGSTCPLHGKCNSKCIIYQAVVKESNSDRKATYIGLTANEFKKRLYNHRQTFKNQNLASSCKLAQHVWSLKNKNIEYEISWNLISKSTTFNPISNVCNLCTLEKYYILYHPDMATINRRTELVTNCHHKSAMLLDNG